jgi:DNA-binding GntR family transcriptional regulator
MTLNDQELAVAARGTYRQIADDLRRRVAAGEFAPGAMLSSEHSLVEAYGVSRGTVRSALAILEDEGLLEPVAGQGRRVAGRRDVADSSTIYERIAAELKARLNEGEFVSGSPLPSEAAVMKQYGVSRNTARRAYRVLAEAGLVVVRHGAGVYAVQR